jgi:hypothetical protein
MSTKAGMKAGIEERIDQTGLALLDEAIEWSGKLLVAYAKLREAERNDDDDAYQEAWADLSTALFILKEKVGPAHDLLDQ